MSDKTDVQRQLIRIQRQLDDMASAERPGRTNISAAGLPLATDDIASGYTKGSIWIFANNAYICVDSTATAAVWKIIT